MYGVVDDSLRRWLAKYRDTHGGSVDSELTLTERARLSRKFYRMTDEGLARLSLERQQWLSFSGRVTSIINPEGHTK